MPPASRRLIVVSVEEARLQSGCFLHNKESVEADDRYNHEYRHDNGDDVNGITIILVLHDHLPNADRPTVLYRLAVLGFLVSESPPSNLLSRLGSGDLNMDFSSSARHGRTGPS